MAVDIVEEIVTETKQVISGLLTDHKQMPYEFNIDKNSDQDAEKSYGFIPLDAEFRDGSAMGFTTMDHNFQIILSDTYQNKDCDESQRTATNKLYERVHCVLKDIQKNRITLPTSGYNVILISGVSFEEPEYFDESSSVYLRATFQFTYRYRNN